MRTERLMRNAYLKGKDTAAKKKRVYHKPRQNMMFSTHLTAFNLNSFSLP